MEKEFKDFLKRYEEKIIPLSKETQLTCFNAMVTGDKEEYKKWENLELESIKIYSNKEDFAKLKKFKESNLIKNPLLKRQLELLYNAYLGYQVDEELSIEITKIEIEIEKKFSKYRAKVNGKELTDNEIKEILRTSKDSEELKKTWLASKDIVKEIYQDTIKVIGLRNKVAKELGFNNYHQMSLILNEQDPEEMNKIFDKLDRLTRKIFIKLKKEMDKVLSGQYKIKAKELMPWHYHNRFFEEAPKIFESDFDKFFKDKDILKVTSEYYSGIGLDITDIIQKSDFYEKKGKYQHACCFNIDKKDDVRVICNIKPNEYWMDTMLHEFGHAVYSMSTNKTKLPWTLREDAHISITEAIALLFGRMDLNSDWLHCNKILQEDEAKKAEEDGFKFRQLDEIIFSRWCQVVYGFEREMYANPEQDLNKLWWDLVEKYQMIKKPEGRNEPDWLSKIHIATSPAYYHNYLLGKILASQLQYYIAENILKSSKPYKESFTGRKEVGEFLKKKIFEVGAKYRWDKMIKKSLGEKLNPKYFAKQFVSE